MTCSRTPAPVDSHGRRLADEVNGARYGGRQHPAARTFERIMLVGGLVLFAWLLRDVGLRHVLA